MSPFTFILVEQCCIYSEVLKQFRLHYCDKLWKNTQLWSLSLSTQTDRCKQIYPTMCFRASANMPRPSLNLLALSLFWVLHWKNKHSQSRQEDTFKIVSVTEHRGINATVQKSWEKKQSWVQSNTVAVGIWKVLNYWTDTELLIRLIPKLVICIPHSEEDNGNHFFKF